MVSVSRIALSAAMGACLGGGGVVMHSMQDTRLRRTRVSSI